MYTQNDVSLAPYTSLHVGGNADTLVTIESTEEIATFLQNKNTEQLWVLGYGANALVADAGLRGTTLLLRNRGISLEGTTIVAESGTWWDDLVQFAITHELWGLELMSAIPGSVGAAVVGNIAAYGQAVSHTLAWIEVIDPHSQEVSRLAPEALELEYRSSILQKPTHSQLIILRAAFTLSLEPTTDVSYQSILDVADDITSLGGRRAATLLAREKAGSLWDYRDSSPTSYNAGSFFRNPMVSPEQADHIMSFDETGKSAELIKKMNLAHGGSQQRVSAAHVLLAAGFSRGQTWGNVRLHPQNLLKLENTGSASANEIHAVVRQIIATVKQKLDVDISPEVRFLGNF